MLNPQGSGIFQKVKLLFQKIIPSGTRAPLVKAVAETAQQTGDKIGHKVRD